jgi:adenylate cyclase
MVSTLDVLSAKILIVDDQPANVLVLERMLRAAGYTAIHSTANPVEVCQLHREQQFTLILLDLKMPVMDGFAVMEQLKELEPEGALPVLVITAEPGHKLRALRAGARDFVSKPLDLSEVLVRVRNMIEGSLLQSETKRLGAELAAMKLQP